MVDRPKVLAEIRGRPFLAFLLDQLTAAGIKRVVLRAGYMGEQVQTVFGHSYGALDLLYSQEASPLGTGGAIRLATDLLRSDPVLVMNGDSYCGVNLRAFWMWHSERDAAGSILLIRALDTKRFGRVQVDSEGLVVGFDEKGEKSGQGWISDGVYFLRHNFILSIRADRTVSLEREIFPLWLGRKLYGYQSAGRFLDIGTPEDYAAAEQFFAP
jgi:NDP-sugar pyrophosphorylase family protein